MKNVVFFSFYVKLDNGRSGCIRPKNENWIGWLCRYLPPLSPTSHFLPYPFMNIGKVSFFPTKFSLLFRSKKSVAHEKRTRIWENWIFFQKTTNLFYSKFLARSKMKSLNILEGSKITSSKDLSFWALCCFSSTLKKWPFVEYIPRSVLSRTCGSPPLPFFCDAALSPCTSFLWCGSPPQRIVTKNGRENLERKKVVFIRGGQEGMAQNQFFFEVWMFFMGEWIVY